MNLLKYFLILSSLCLFAYIANDFSSKELSNIAHYQLISGRNQERAYRIKVPADWRRVDPESTAMNTQIPLCEFYIEEVIRITIHNFPSQTIEDRIPPGAQIARWKKQFLFLDENVLPQSFSGYIGYLFEAENDEISVMAWTMQLGPVQYSRLSQHGVPAEWRSDVTIKAQGPLELVQKYRQQIINFARSFELIQEI